MLDVFVAFVDIGLSAAVYVALHTAADDVLMGGHDAGAAVVDEFEPFGQRRAAAGEQFDRFHRGRVVFRAERYDETVVVQVAGVLLKHFDAVARRDEFYRENTALAQDLGRFHDVLFEVGESALRIVRQEWVGRDAPGGQDDLAYRVHRQECFRVFRDESRSARFEQVAANFVLDGGEVAEEGKVSEVFAAPQSQAAKRLVYPEGYEQPVVRFDEGKMLRVVFNGAKATKTPLIAQMALDCGITASILGASTKGIGEKAYGNMLLGIPGGDAELQRAMDYLRSIPDIFVEEVDGHV